MKIIGLTGTNAAGKGEAAKFFIHNGYSYFSLSDLIRDELRINNQPITRNNLIKTGNALREAFGPDILARRVMEKIEGNAVIDSIRNPQEIAYLKQNRSFTLLAIDAPLSIRFDRAKERGRDESASTVEEFKNKEAEELTNHEKGQQLSNCMKMAAHTIINDGSLSDFHRKLEVFL